MDAPIITPEWIADKIDLFVDDTVLILDDDSAIHSAWEKRFQADGIGLRTLHFTYASEMLAYVSKLSFEQKDALFLLTDYELLKQELTGLDVVKKTGLTRSILVTSHYENTEVKELAALTRTKILPKPLASEIPIKISERKEKEQLG